MKEGSENYYIEYLVIAPTAGRYTINVASRADAGVTNNVQNWKINDNDYVFTGQKNNFTKPLSRQHVHHILRKHVSF